MNEKRPEGRAPHSVVINDRKNMNITAVDDVISFDENTIVLGSGAGVISIDGEGLHIRKMSVETGEIGVEGKINSLSYIDKRVSRGGLFKKR